MIWPTPTPMTTQLFLGVEATRVELPVIPAAKYRTPAFLPPAGHEERPDGRYLESVAWPRGFYEMKKDLWSTKTSVEWKGHGTFENQGRLFRTWERNFYETSDLHPAESRFSGEAGRHITIDDRTIEIRSTIEV